MSLLNTLRQRRLRIRRDLEAMRLRRARRHTRPGYERCMNCGAALKGMYCHRCGQYALDIHQPIWKYIRQYFENVYQFDGKIWMTLRLMFTRPGFLTNEFNEGKINSYVHPFRLYMCISVVFFPFFFMVAQQQTDRALLLMQGNRVPADLADSLRQGRLRPDTTVYAYNVPLLAEVLDRIGVDRADTLLVSTATGLPADALDLVRLPHSLLERSFTRTSLRPADRAATRFLHNQPEELRNQLWDTLESGQAEQGENMLAMRDHSLIYEAEQGLLHLVTLDDDDPEAFEYLTRAHFTLPLDSGGQPLAAIYDWIPSNRITGADRLRYQSTANTVMGTLSKWTPLFLMFLLPLQALLFKAFYPRRRYMEHFAHATHLGTVFLLFLTPPAFIGLWHFNLGNNSHFEPSLLENFIFAAMPLLMVAYQIVSTRTVYRDPWPKTLVKSLLAQALFTLLAAVIAGGLIAWLALQSMGKL